MLLHPTPLILRGFSPQTNKIYTASITGETAWGLPRGSGRDWVGLAFCGKGTDSAPQETGKLLEFRAHVRGFLQRRVGRLNLGLDRLRDVMELVTLGALISPIVAATIGTTTLSLAHVKAWSSVATALAVWWIGDAMGILIAAPLVLAA